MINPAKMPRARLTLPILGYACIDIVGMLLLTLGGAYLARGPGIFFPDFPSSTAAAAALTITGIGLMVFASGRLLGETMKQAQRIADEIDAARGDR